jgi:hypothetical protein
MTRILMPLLAGAVLASAGCGGKSTSGTATATTTGTTASGSFSVNFKHVQQQLRSGLKQVEHGDAVTAIVGGGAVLTNCTDTVTSQLDARAKTSAQKEAVSQLRTACADVSEAMQKLKNGDTAAAEQLAQTAAQEVAEANASSK